MWIDARSLFSLVSFCCDFYCHGPFPFTHALEHATFLVYDSVQFYLVYLCGVHKPESLFIVSHVQ
jgi:hypothetical protein